MLLGEATHGPFHVEKGTSLVPMITAAFYGSLPSEPTSSPSLVLFVQMHCAGASIPAQAANPAEFWVLWKCHFSKRSWAVWLCPPNPASFITST